MAADIQQSICSFLSNVNIWSTFGTWTGAIFAAIAARYLYKLQKQVFDNERQYKELELKINLYEKRYSIYLILKRYAEVFNVIKILPDEVKMPDNTGIPKNSFVSMLLFSTSLQGVGIPNDYFSMFVLSKNYTSNIDQIKFYFYDTRLHALCTNLIATINNYALHGNDHYADAVSAVEEFESYGAMEKIEDHLYTYKKLSS